MKNYTDIFFDLDRTLWDFDRNSGETLTELFEKHQLQNKLGIKAEVFINTFREINADAWKQFRSGEQSKDDMRVNRFVQCFFAHDYGDWKLARQISKEYTETCPHKPNLVNGAKELLDHLKSNHQIHIITNGFSQIQDLKIKASGLTPYLSCIIISEETPYRKPNKAIFKFAALKAKTTVDQSLMVGDDWHSDIKGAKNANMDQAYYNPLEKEIIDDEPTYELKRILDLKNCF